MKERDTSSSRQSSSQKTSGDHDPRDMARKKGRLNSVDPNPRGRTTEKVDVDLNPRGKTTKMKSVVLIPRGQTAPDNSQDARRSPRSRSVSSSHSSERSYRRQVHSNKRITTHSGRKEPTMSRSKSRSSSPVTNRKEKSNSPDNDIIELDIPLDDTMLSLLGDAPATITETSDNLHQDIVKRWKQTMKAGLTKEVKDDLIKKYPPPKNCQEMVAPKVNAEIAATMSQASLKKDSYQVSAQNQLSAALSAVGKGLTLLLTDIKMDASIKTPLVSIMGDAGRLLAGLHHSNSLTRRSFITPSLSTTVKPIADKSPIDQFLYGKDLADTLKAARAIEKTGKELKARSTGSRQYTKKGTAPYSKNNSSQSSSQKETNLNWKRPSGQSGKYPKDRRYGQSNQTRQRR